MGTAPDPEQSGIAHSTKPLSDLSRFHERLANVVALIRTHFIRDEEWTTEAKPGYGSITIQNRVSGQVIKAFVDDGSRLANEKLHLGIKGVQVAVGVELTHLSAEKRARLRDSLDERFGRRYADVRQAFPKVYLRPQDTFFYDIVFPEEGLAGLKPDPDILADSVRVIAAAAV